MTIDSVFEMKELKSDIVDRLKREKNPEFRDEDIITSFADFYERNDRDKAEEFVNRYTNLRLIDTADQSLVDNDYENACYEILIYSIGADFYFRNSWIPSILEITLTFENRLSPS